MNPGAMLNFVPLLIGIFAVQPAIVGQSVTRLVEQDEIVLRVPVQPRPLMPQFEWHEKKGPKCLPVRAIRRALLSGPEQVDFILGNNRRVRAHLDEDCAALDFYGGFYLQLQDDRLCAGRDMIRSRMGGTCTIERFRMLVPTVRRQEQASE